MNVQEKYVPLVRQLQKVHVTPNLTKKQSKKNRSPVRKHIF